MGDGKCIVMGSSLILIYVILTLNLMRIMVYIDIKKKWNVSLKWKNLSRILIS